MGEIIQGQIYSLGDIDYYKIEITKPGVLIANVTNVPSEIRMELSLFDSGQEKIGGISGAGGNPVNIIKSVCDPGIYYYALEDRYNGSLSPELYDFKVEFDTSDIYECNNSFADATNINVCDTIIASIYDSDDEDFFVFDGVMNSIIDISLSNIPENTTLRLDIYNVDGNKIFSHAGTSNHPILINFEPEYSGQFFIKIEDSGSGSSNELYNLVLVNSSCISEINDFYISSNIQVYPNPVNTVINIENQSAEHFRILNLINSKGELIKQFEGDKTILDVHNEQGGLYFLIFIDEKGNSYSKKILKF